MAWFKTGGGALSETALWTNPSPTAAFVNQEITLNDDISNYQYVKVQCVANASTGATKYSTIISVDDFILSQEHAALFAISTRLATSSGDALYHRYVRSTSNTKVRFGQAYKQSSSTASNGYAVPLKISGLK